MKISKREKLFIGAAVAFILLFVVIQYGVTPFLNNKKRMTALLHAKGIQLQQMHQMKDEYDALLKQIEESKKRFAQREKGFALFSFLDRLAGESKIKENITYMKPSKSTQKDSPYIISSVEMKLQAINMKQLTSYLHMVETSKNFVYVRRISISQTNKPEGFINVILQVETYEIA